MLKAVPGVVDVEVDYPSKTATVVARRDVPADTVLTGLTGRYSATLKE